MNILSTRISKAKIKDGQLGVSLEHLDKDTERKTELRSLDGYHPDMQRCFDDLVPHVREILGWPHYLYAGAGELIVTGVSWSHSENTGVEGAVMVCQAKLPEGTSNSPFCFNTPHLPYDQYSEDGQQPVMPADAVAALNRLQVEVGKYLDGKRAQGDMFSPKSLADEVHETVVEAAARAVGISTAKAKAYLGEPGPGANVVTEADMKAFKALTLKRSAPSRVDA